MRVKRAVIILTALLLVSEGVWAMASTNHILDWFVPLTGAGGGAVTSIHYAADYTVGQAAVGRASSANHAAGLGYWYGSLTGADLLKHRVYLPIVLSD